MTGDRLWPREGLERRPVMVSAQSFRRGSVRGWDMRGTGSWPHITISSSWWLIQPGNLLW
jgi:hypothetical protein